MPVFDFFKEKQQASSVYREILAADIVPNPYQPRATFDDESIMELARSIEQVGLIQPLVVRRVGERTYELVAGERRLRACKLLQMEGIPCIVREEVEDEASAMMALIENLQREDLHFIEEAQCYSALLQTYNLTQDDLAKRLGKSQSFVANKLRLLKLSAQVKDAMKEANLSERHARSLLKLRSDEEQLEVIERITSKGLSVKETEKMVDKKLNALYDQRADGARPRPMIVRLVKDYRLFMNSINISVNQLREAGFTVELEQAEQDNGVSIHIEVSKP